MPDENERLEWARTEANRLRMLDQSGYLGNGSRGASHIASAVEFLRVQAGSASAFYKGAAAASGYSASLAVSEVASFLEGWVAYVEAGLADSPLVLRSRVEAATDLMEQVQRLLDDSKVHPAAPVMLAGAALEEYLRGLIEANSLTVKGKPGLNAYASALRTAELLGSQDVKDVTALAGTRNDAAHGDFDKISLDRARLMADQINLFLRQKVVSST